MRRTKLQDVATAAGVSKGAASHVFNHPERVKKEVRQHVLRVAAELGYSGADPAARALKAGKMGCIGVLTINPLSYFFEDPFAQVFMQGVADTCRSRGVGLTLIETGDVSSARTTVSNALVDGFIVLCTEKDDPVAHQAIQRGLRTITVDYPVPGESGCVLVDNIQGAKLAAQHAITLGHHDIGVLMFPEEPGTGYYSGTAADRLCGYRKACEDASNSRILLTVVESMPDPKNVGLALDKLLQENSSISALLCGTDRMAMNAIRHAKMIGIAVPDSLSVIGFDDIPAAVHSEPALTTVHQPIYQKGCSAVELLFGDRNDSIKLDVSLKVRDSSAPRQHAPKLT